MSSRTAKATPKEEKEFEQYTKKVVADVKKEKTKHPCPNHPDQELDVTGPGKYIMGENNPKKTEISGVGFCPKCGFHLTFSYKK